MFVLKSKYYSFLAPLFTIVFISSASYAMQGKRAGEDNLTESNKKQKIENALSIQNLPSDLLVYIYQTFLNPIDIIHSEVVSKKWYSEFHHLNYWLPLGGWQFSPSIIERGEEAMKILNDVFEDAPDSLKNAFPHTFPLKELPCKNFNQEPKLETVINFFKFQYFRAYGYKEKAFTFLKKTCETKHPNALWKYAKEIDLNDKKNKKTEFEAWDNGTYSNFKYSKYDLDSHLYYLEAALGGEPKAQAKLFNIMLNKLLWKNALESHSKWGGTYENTISDQKYKAKAKSFAFLFGKFVELAEIWPEGRKYLLTSGIPTKFVREPLSLELQEQFDKISKGQPAELSFGPYGKVSINVEWKVANFVLGKHYLALCQNADALKSESAINFQKAHSINVGKLLDLLNGYLSSHTISERTDIQKVLFISSNSNYLTTLAQIKLNAIPTGTALDDTKVQDFLIYMKNAHQILMMKSYTSRFIYANKSGINSDYQNAKCMKATQASRFINTVGAELNQKSEELTELKTAFLEWFVTTNSPISNHGNWFRAISRTYFLTKNWGAEFLKTGNLAHIDKEDQLLIYENWDSKDTLCAFAAFQKIYIKPQHQMYKLLLDISNHNKKERDYILSFRNFCHTIMGGKVTDEICNYLSKKLNALAEPSSRLRLKPSSLGDLYFCFGKLINDSKKWSKSTIKSRWQSKAKKYFEMAAKAGSEEAIKFLTPIAPNKNDYMEADD